MDAATGLALAPYRITDENDPRLTVWRKAWGKRWPRRTGLIKREGDTFSHHESARTDESFIITESFYDNPFPTPVEPGETSTFGGSDPNLDVVPPVDVDEPKPYDGRTHEWDYSCLVETRPLRRLVHHVPLAVIERDEYRYLLYALCKLGAEITPPASDATEPQESDRKRFLMTGQSGTGKTIFLVWLLLHLLEHQQPVALQTVPGHYFVFRPDGVFWHHVHGPYSKLLNGVWALVDCNESVHTPADPLTDQAKVLVYACWPEKARSAAWSKHNKAQCIVTEVPHIFEAAAAGQECGWAGGLDTSVDLYRRFGPSLRMLRGIQASAPHEQRVPVKVYERKVSASARALLRHSVDAADLAELGAADSELAYIRPTRGIHDWRSYDLDALGSCWLDVPTDYLRNWLYEAQLAHPETSVLQLWVLLSGHALTRSLAGWAFETRMHRTFGRAGTELDLIGVDGQIRSTRDVLPAMLAALAWLSPDRSCYWLPPAFKLPGIDAVLTNNDRLFVLHATVPGEQSCPEKGLNEVWNALGPALTDRFHWHFVVVARTNDLADESLARFQGQLAGFTLGEARRPVTVAAAVLPGFV